MENLKEQELVAGLKEMETYDPNYRRRPQKKSEQVSEETKITPEQSIENPLSSDTLVMIKIGGEDKEISLDELKKGYMMQSDYTKKTQELATLKQEYSSGLDRAAKAIAMFNDNLHNPNFRKEENRLRNIIDNIDWENISHEELGHLIQLKVKYENVKRANDKHFRDMEAVKKSMMQEHEAYRARIKAEELARLQEILPEMGDEGKGKEILSQMAKYIETRVGKDKVMPIIGGLSDHRDFLILRDAMIGNDYLVNKLPKKSVIKSTKRMGNDGIKSDLTDTALKSQGDRILRDVKSRGPRAAATKDELMTILKSKISK